MAPAPRRASSLLDAPGHAFGSVDDEQLAEIFKAAIYMGWDARAFSNPLRCMIDLSHNNIITLRSHDNLSDVTARLIGFGLTPITTANRKGL